MTPRAELILAADGLPMELPLLQGRTGPRCVGAAAEERPHVGLWQWWSLHEPARSSEATGVSRALLAPSFSCGSAGYRSQG